MLTVDPMFCDSMVRLSTRIRGFELLDSSVTSDLPTSIWSKAVSKEVDKSNTAAEGPWDLSTKVKVKAEFGSAPDAVEANSVEGTRRFIFSYCISQDSSIDSDSGGDFWRQKVKISIKKLSGVRVSGSLETSLSIKEDPLNSFTILRLLYLPLYSR